MSMKKLMLFAALLGFAVACGGNEKKEEPKNDEATVEATAEVDASEEATEEATETEEVVADNAATKSPVVDNEQPMESTIKGEVTEIDHSKGMTATDIDIHQVDLATATKDNTGAKKGNQLHVGGATKELNKSANAQVGTGLNTTKLEVVK